MAKKWENKIDTFIPVKGREIDQPLAFLNAYGKEGWEPYHVHTEYLPASNTDITTVYFKREVE